MSSLVMILAILAAVTVVARFLLTRQHPETAATYVPPDAVTSFEQLDDNADRPAGPEAGRMNQDRLGGDHRRAA